MALRNISKAFPLRKFSNVFSAMPIRRFSEEPETEEIKEKKDSLNQSTVNKIAELEAKIKTVEIESLKHKDLYIRAVAEQENIRKRLIKEIENEGNYAITKFAKEIIEVHDNLYRALENTTKQQQKNENSAKVLKDLVEGVSMTREILKNVFGKFKIVEYSPIGEKFDPNFHEALFSYEDKNKEHGSVGQVLSNGYKIKDRVLRSAKVGVVKK